MMDVSGYLAALGTILLWGSYIVPFKKSPTISPYQFQLYVGLSIFLFALFVSPFIGYSININGYGIASGMIWALGNVISLSAVRYIGVARAMPLWVSTVILISFLWGVIVFHELPLSIWQGVLGIGFIILGVILVGSSGDVKHGNVKKGIFLGLLAGIVFGSTFAPLKLGNIAPSDFLFPMSLGTALFALCIALVKRVHIHIPRKAIIMSMLSGVILSIGNILGITTIAFLGLAKGSPITQASVLVAVLWGLLYFKESASRTMRVKILVGAIVLFIGVILLGLA